MSGECSIESVFPLTVLLEIDHTRGVGLSGMKEVTCKGRLNLSTASLFELLSACPLL